MEIERKENRRPAYSMLAAQKHSRDTAESCQRLEPRLRPAGKAPLAVSPRLHLEIGGPDHCAASGDRIANYGSEHREGDDFRDVDQWHPIGWEHAPEVLGLVWVAREVEPASRSDKEAKVSACGSHTLEMMKPHPSRLSGTVHSVAEHLMSLGARSLPVAEVERRSDKGSKRWADLGVVDC